MEEPIRLKATEIGTSTGFSAIWIAWALSKTWGKLITIEIGGFFTAHNATNTGSEGNRKFLDYVKGLDDFKTTIDITSMAGISISYKAAAE